MSTRKSKRNQELTRLYFAAGLAAVSYTFFKLYKVFSQAEISVLGTSRWSGLLALGLANTLVIGLILFIVARALAKIYFERRSGILGSRIRTKLVVAFLAVGIVPSVMLFIMGRPFILRNIERWFAPETGRIIRDGGEVSRMYKSEQLARVKQEAETAARLHQPPQLVLSEFALDLCSDSKQTVVRDRTAAPDLSGDSPAWTVDAGADGTWYLGRHGEWVTGRLLGRNIQDSLARLERRQEEVRQLGTITNTLVEYTDNVLLFMTLLTIFAAVWSGLTLSRTIAEPVRALAKAAQRVGMGDLEVALPEEGEDELAFLSRSFNAMTRDLKAGNRENKRHAERIERQRAYLNELMDALPVGVLSLSTDGQLLTCNNTAQSWLGMASFDPDGQYWSDPGWRSRLGDLPYLLERVRQSGRPYQEELRIGREGEGRPVKVMAVPLSGGGELAVLEDLSLLAQAEKRAAWQEVARRMAHEVKNPLTPIKLTAQRLARRVRDGRLEPQAVSEGAETILAEVESLSLLVDSFTRFAKLPVPQPTQCDACELMRQVHALYESGQGKARLELLLPAEPVTVIWDGDMVKRALINFADNAIHTIQDSGTITLEVKVMGSRVRLSVSDDGPGVPQEVRPRLFEPYFSTKQRGTGLGLAIARKIAEDHGGVAVYESLEPGCTGSMFYLELPVNSISE
uniref:histidine kinase n=1 Tax=uncultured bacterium contig00038 TaxID=1181526 RepID=A0A806KFS5_9BACT|nr:nitrogen regulation protein ntrY [uncultured bacterium contig00038]